MALKISAAGTQPAEACGAKGSTATVQRKGRATANVRLKDPPGLRWGGRHARLLVDRCQDGQWRPISSRRFGTRGAYRRTRSYALKLPTGNSADLRVRVTVAGDRHRRPASTKPAYLRVGAGEIVDTPVTFMVDNVNRTRVPCQADGSRQTISAHLMAPRSALTKPDRSVAIYLHGVEISDAYFRYRDTPGYDFQGEMAELGHASVVVDRLGHGQSAMPPGQGICVGSQADMASQMVDLLRTGGYRAANGSAPAFQRVALAGHSFGSFTAEIAQGSFKKGDVLVLMAFAAEGVNGGLLADRQSRGEAGSCTGGSGMEKTPGGPRGYAYLWPSTDQWAADTFANAEPEVVQHARAFRERSPCGELNSSVTAGIVDGTLYNEITVPVVMIFAKQDAVFPPPAGENHRQLYKASNDVTLHEIDNAGHTLMLQRTAPEFRAKLSAWLKQRGF